jgi:hypothetical protein
MDAYCSLLNKMKMKVQMKYLAGLFFMLLSAAACKEDDQALYTFPDPDDGTLIDLPEEWKAATSLMSGFPEGIEVYRNTTPYKGKAMNAYCVVFDPKDPGLEFKPVLAATNTKPSELYVKESGTKYACINAGFFGTNVSYSLVQYSNTIHAVNIKAVTRPYNGFNTTYYPTRGAFGLTEENTPEVAWIYHVGSGSGTMYSYPAPSSNRLNSAPEPQPSATFPEGGTVWNVGSAIGGSPVLVKDGAVNITDTEELIAIDNNASRARSAIGHTADGKVVLLAVEGNNPDGGAGLNLQELAQLMKDMGCTGALNLDGGGSTFMVVNGKPTVKPSGAERAV